MRAIFMTLGGEIRNPKIEIRKNFNVINLQLERDPGPKVADFELRVSNFGFRISNLGIRILNSGFQILLLVEILPSRRHRETFERFPGSTNRGPYPPRTAFAGCLRLR